MVTVGRVTEDGDTDSLHVFPCVGKLFIDVPSFGGEERVYSLFQLLVNDSFPFPSVLDWGKWSLKSKEGTDPTCLQVH